MHNTAPLVTRAITPHYGTRVKGPKCIFTEGKLALTAWRKLRPEIGRDSVRERGIPSVVTLCKIQSCELIMIYSRQIVRKLGSRAYQATILLTGISEKCLKKYPLWSPVLSVTTTIFYSSHLIVQIPDKIGAERATFGRSIHFTPTPHTLMFWLTLFNSRPKGVRVTEWKKGFYSELYSTGTLTFTLNKGFFRLCRDMSALCLWSPLVSGTSFLCVRAKRNEEAHISR